MFTQNLVVEVYDDIVAHNEVLAEEIGLML